MAATNTFHPIFQHQEDKTEYRLLTQQHVSTQTFNGKKMLVVEPEGLQKLARQAFYEIAFFQRASHLKQVAQILKDPQASDNDRFVAANMIENAVVSSQEVLPFCQDTGTAIILGYKGQQVWTGANDHAALSEGVRQVYTEENLRYSQISPQSMVKEKNTGDNLPAQIDLFATEGDTYELLFIAKGGGSANKTFLYQETQSLLTEERLSAFLREKLMTLGTAACPPYHIAIVIGGTSAEATLKTVKLASAGYYDDLPTQGGDHGSAFRDLEWEARVMKMAETCGIGAQFGGKCLAHDVRVIRMPRHAASCPVGLGVSCSADRNAKAKITRDGIFLEVLERNPQQYLPAEGQVNLAPPVQIDLNKPMDEIRAELSKHPIKTRLSLNGTLIVARDIAHARIHEILRGGGKMPAYFRNHPVYYAGPAKKPEGKPSGSFGPTTAQRMDVYVDEFMSHKGSMIMLAKGNRTKAVTEACKKHGGFYLGSIGGPAAILADRCIKKVELVDFEELGMEAVRKIEVVDFPAFMIVDDKGHDFFAELMR